MTQAKRKLPPSYVPRNSPLAHAAGQRVPPAQFWRMVAQLLK